MNDAVAWTVVLPLAGAVAVWLSGRRLLAPILWLIVPATALAAVAVGLRVWRDGPLRYRVGGWGAPLGIDLYADGLSAAMLLAAGLTLALTSVYAYGYFPRQPRHGFFWPLWLFLWGALNVLFLSADLFNLYVALELLTFTAVALVALAGGRALAAALRYFFAATLGSFAYLLGVALLYGLHGTLDIALLAERLAPGPPAWAAIALVVTGLLLKTAVFPLHFWLPAAHAGAPSPVSAALSALVIKASFYMLVRLWFGAFPAALAPGAANLLGALGAAAIVWGSIQALRQPRLKMLVAYSTVAQVGYLFLLFPLAVAGAAAWGGALYQAISHAFAKASMFLAAGTLLQALGHDRVRDITGMVRHFPITVFAFGLAGMSLMGLPPSGGFIAKWLLLSAAVQTGQWWWVPVILGGGLLAAAYVFRVLRFAFVARVSTEPWRPVTRGMELSALALALLSLALGFRATEPLALLSAGAPLPP